MKINRSGFTMIEIMLVLAIFALTVSSLAIPVTNFLEKSELNRTSSALLQKLKQAQTNAQMNLQTSDWGVYFDDDSGGGGDDHRYIFFRGSTLNDYPSSQEEYPLANNLRFTSISLNRGLDEVVFEKNSGNTLDFGTVDLYNMNRLDTVYTFSINALGLVEITK